MALYIVGDSLGPSWAHQVLWSIGGKLLWPALNNLASFWLVGIPLGCALAFGAGLGLFGLWTGLVAGMWLLSTGLLLYLGYSVDWRAAAEQAQAKASVGGATHEGAKDHTKELPRLPVDKELSPSAAPSMTDDRTGRLQP